MTCLVCGSRQTDRCHIKTRGAGGTDDEWNIMLLCREHHVEQHKIGIVTFMLKYEEVQVDLILKGWRLNEYSKLFNELEARWP